MSNFAFVPKLAVTVSASVESIPSTAAIPESRCPSSTPHTTMKRPIATSNGLFRGGYFGRKYDGLSMKQSPAKKPKAKPAKVDTSNLDLDPDAGPKFGALVQSAAKMGHKPYSASSGSKGRGKSSKNG